jgi:hypothetical protein
MGASSLSFRDFPALSFLSYMGLTLILRNLLSFQSYISPQAITIIVSDI